MLRLCQFRVSRPLPLLLFFFCFAIAIAVACSPRSCWATHFLYNGFDPASQAQIRCFQGALFNASALQLTATNAIQGMGRCLFSSPVQLLDDSGLPVSFSTQFIFLMDPGPESLVDGLAFVVAPSLGPVDGSNQGFMGLFSNDTNGKASTRTLGIEFDAYKNPEFRDMDDNHVGIDVNDIVSWHATSSAVKTSSSPEIRSFQDGYAVQLKGSYIQAWIDYNASTNELNISVSRMLGNKPIYALISNRSLDLPSVFNTDMYVGFTASTGPLDDILYYVYSWSFSTEGASAAVQMPTVSSSSSPSDAKKKKKAKIVIAVGVLVGTLALLSSLAGFAFFYTRRRRRVQRRLFGGSNACEELDFSLNQNTPQKFSYRDLSKATQDFNKRNLLGSGGFGAVYKGKLPSTGTEVAVKRISEESKQGVKEFVSEVTTIGQLRHRNLVPLLGWCQEKGFMLVYELMPNGSLDRFLFEARKRKEGDRALSWQMRLHILKGVAAAVNYLHEECEQKIVHRDIKTSNVMLDAGLNARLGDFGLARPYGHDVAPGTTNVAGTWGYIAPEAFYTRKATEKTDVFSFGALTLEVVTGKKICEHIDDEGCGLIEWLWRLHKDKRLFEAADPSMEMTEEKAENAMLMHVLELGLSCCYAEPSCRPSMRYALQVLCGDVQPVPLPPSFSSPFYVSAELPQYFTSVSNSYGSDSVAPTRRTDDSTDG